MRLHELLNEGWADDFNKYRKLGQEPLKLAGHIAKGVLGGNKTKTVNNVNTPKQTKVPTLSSVLGNDATDVKTALDKIIAGQQLDSHNIQILKGLRNKL